MEKLLQKHLGITMNEIEKMSEVELNALVERAFNHEVDVAVDNNGEYCQEGNDAAHVADFLNDLFLEKYGT